MEIEGQVKEIIKCNGDAVLTWAGAASYKTADYYGRKANGCGVSRDI